MGYGMVCTVELIECLDVIKSSLPSSVEPSSVANFGVPQRSKSVNPVFAHFTAVQSA